MLFIVGKNMIEIPAHIKDSAQSLVDKGVELPLKIPGALGFVVARSNDKTVQAFGAFTHKKQTYKIGTLKKSS